MASEREKNDKSKSNSSGKHIPKDAQVIMSIMKELNVTDYEPRVINQLLEFTYREYIIENSQNSLSNLTSFARSLCSKYERKKTTMLSTNSRFVYF